MGVLVARSYRKRHRSAHGTLVRPMAIMHC